METRHTLLQRAAVLSTHGDVTQQAAEDRTHRLRALLHEVMVCNNKPLPLVNQHRVASI